MGWRGTLRSINAAGRQAQRATDRRNRAVSKLHAKASSVLTGLDAEIEKEIQRIEKYEEKIASHPTKTLQLRHEVGQGWKTAPFKEQTGVVTYEVRYTPPSQDVTFEPASIDVGGIQITPLAISVSQYFTAVAFEARADPDEGGRVLKLTFPNKPESSRIALANPEGEVFNPLDTSLDGRVFAGTTRTGSVTFEPFGEGHDFFEILVEGPPRKRGGEGETLRIRVSAATMKDEMTASIAQPSILEQMTEQLRGRQKKTQDEIGSKLAEASKSSSGCLVVIAAIGLAIGAAVAIVPMI